MTCKPRNKEVAKKVINPGYITVPLTQQARFARKDELVRGTKRGYSAGKDTSVSFCDEKPTGPGRSLQKEHFVQPLEGRTQINPPAGSVSHNRL